MLQNFGSVTTRINPPLSPAEREQRYRQALRELRDPRGLRELREPRPTLQIGITEDMVSGLLKRGYLGPDECDDLIALRQAVTLFIWDTIRKTPKTNRKTEEKKGVRTRPCAY
jgi:hypothetical protein